MTQKFKPTSRQWLMACLLLLSNLHSFAQFTPLGEGMIGQWWYHSLTATSHNYPSILSTTIYDDWQHPQYGGTTSDPIYFNCQRNFLFTTYTNPEDNVDLTINVNSTSAFTEFDVYVYLDRSDLFLPPLLVTTYIDKHPTDIFNFSATTQGLYIITVMKHDDDPDTDPSLIKGFLPMIPKVKKLWIEATPICTGAYSPGTHYNFRVKTDPDISTISNHYTLLGYVNVPAVTTWPTEYYNINCDNTFRPWNIDMTIYVSDLVSYYTDVTNLSSAGEVNYFNLNNKRGIDVSNYYIEAANINEWVSSTGSNYGNTPFIKVDYNDRIATTYSVTAPIIIKTPTADITASSNPTAIPPDEIYGPPNAVGLPVASFDVYDYNVSGNETWTPTSNPFTVMQGGGTLSTIRVQNRLKIPAGSSLTLSGMRLEFGPNGSAVLECASTASGSGGLLNVVAGSELTAYRGCVGTENSTWKGVTLVGNNSFPIPLTGTGTSLDFYSMPQGKINIRNSTISYAEIGISSGTGAYTMKGGGGINAYNSSFLNNTLAVKIYPFQNVISGITYYSVLSFTNCSFEHNNSSSVTPANFINAQGVKGMSITGTVMNYNKSGVPILIGVAAIDVSMNLSNNVFRNMQNSIFDLSISGTRSSRILNNQFYNNYKALTVTGGIAPLIQGNTFDIPKYSGTLSGSYYTGSGVITLNDQNVGAIIKSTTGYNLYGNTFKTTGATGPYNYYPYTTGTVQYQTGSDQNLVIDNSFTGLGVAMSSTFVNRNFSGLSGLRYQCNKDQHIGFDIAVCGNNIVDGGINLVQASIASSGAWASAGNKFSVQWNVYNQQKPIHYHYLTTDEFPANTFGSVTVSTPINASRCIVPGGTGGPYAHYRIVGSQNLQSYLPGIQNSAELRYTMATSNINYYLNKYIDTVGGPQRDSVYFWASEMNSAYGDLLITCLLVEDSLVDSALIVYDNIFTKYSLDTPEVVDFVNGRNLIQLMIEKRSNGNNILDLDSSQVVSLEWVRDNTKMWAHARAEVWLYAFRGDSFTDTLLYPAPPDSVQQTIVPKGALAVTEFSQGAESGCQYVELIVASCGDNKAPEVDVRGWMINDYSGALTDCGGYNANPGHYKLAADNVWSKIPVGSVIVLYNHDNNCYNLPDSFSIDTFNSVYYIPVGGAGALHVEQYYPAEDSSPCNYCSDSGARVYTDSLTWGAIGIDSVLDAIQVLCPGCTVDIPSAPRLYFSAGFSDRQGSSGTIGTDSIGYVVIPNTDSASGYKYVFTGVDARQLLSPSRWTVSAADAAGSKPATLGNVNIEFFENILAHTAMMPCCGTTQGNEQGNGAGKPANNKNTTEAVHGGNGVKVYPNPASMMLYFEYTTSAKATIRITDVTGRLIDQQVIKDAGRAAIDVKGYAPGVYMYQITTATSTHTGKVVIGN